jgi:hypothetical protein
LFPIGRRFARGGQIVEQRARFGLSLDQALWKAHTPRQYGSLQALRQVDVSLDVAEAFLFLFVLNKRGVWSEACCLGWIFPLVVG